MHSTAVVPMSTGMHHARPYLRSTRCQRCDLRHVLPRTASPLLAASIAKVYNIMREVSEMKSLKSHGKFRRISRKTPIQQYPISYVDNLFVIYLLPSPCSTAAAPMHLHASCTPASAFTRFQVRSKARVLLRTDNLQLIGNLTDCPQKRR